MNQVGGTRLVAPTVDAEGGKSRRNDLNHSGATNISLTEPDGDLLGLVLLYRQQLYPPEER